MKKKIFDFFNYLYEFYLGKQKSKKNETAPDISPVLSRRLNKDKLSQTMSSSRLRTLSQAAQNTDVTIFHIPGMEVKLHYDSKVVDEEDQIEPKSNQIFSFDTIHEESNDGKVNPKKGGVKKASLFVWMTLESFPEEAVLTPHILEFLEQTLEPIPIKDHLNFSGMYFFKSPLTYILNLKESLTILVIKN